MPIRRQLAALFDARLRAAMGSLIESDGSVDFARPVGEPALTSPDALAWQVFRNPLTMFIGGVAAVLLELGEPSVRTAVWRHSSFRAEPARRLRRTGMAAMVTVYGAASVFERTAARVRAMHARVDGVTPGGTPYRADDPELLRWVQSTAAFAFLRAYREYVRPVRRADRDRYYREGVAGAAMYGATGVPASEAEFDAMLAAMLPRLEPSPILDELIAILRTAPILPPLLRWLQPVVVRAAVDLLPPTARARIGVGRHGGLGAAEALLLRTIARGLDGMTFAAGPAAQACVRLGLPADYLTR